MGFYEDSFNKSIIDIIDQMSHGAYWIHLFEDVDCTCIEHTSKKPDPSCKKCLGTGHRIRIKDIEVSTDDEGSGRIEKGMAMQKVVYAKAKWELSLNDLIIEDGDVYYVFQKIEGHSFHEQHVFNKYICPRYKFNTKILLKNFYEIVGDKHV